MTFRFSKRTITYSILICVVLLIAASYIFRGWFRETATRYVSWRYKSSLESSFERASKELNYGQQSLGLKLVHETPAACDLNTAQTFFAEVGCTVGFDGKAVINSDYIQKYSGGWQNLQEALEVNHWAESRGNDSANPHTFTELVHTGKSSDDVLGYYGSVFYTKKINSNNCSFSAMRNDKLVVGLDCSRTTTVVF